MLVCLIYVLIREAATYRGTKTTIIHTVCGGKEHTLWLQGQGHASIAWENCTKLGQKNAARVLLTLWIVLHTHTYMLVCTTVCIISWNTRICVLTEWVNECDGEWRHTVKYFAANATNNANAKIASWKITRIYMCIVLIAGELVCVCWRESALVITDLCLYRVCVIILLVKLHVYLWILLKSVCISRNRQLNYSKIKEHEDKKTHTYKDPTAALSLPPSVVAFESGAPCLSYRKELNMRQQKKPASLARFSCFCCCCGSRRWCSRCCCCWPVENQLYVDSAAAVVGNAHLPSAQCVCAMRVYVSEYVCAEEKSNWRKAFANFILTTVFFYPCHRRSCFCCWFSCCRRVSPWCDGTIIVTNK